MDLGILFLPEFSRARGKRNGKRVRAERQQVSVNDREALLIAARVKDALIELIVIPDHALFHFDRAVQVHVLLHKRAFGADIIIHRCFKHRDGLCMNQILEVKNHILAVTDMLVHPNIIPVNDVFPIDLVPQHPVIEIRRRPHHLVGILAPVDQPGFVDGSLL